MLGGQRLELGHEAPVDLVGVHEAGALEQRAREQAVGGPDLEDDVVGADGRLREHGPQHVAVDEVVLAVAAQGARPGAVGRAPGPPAPLPPVRVSPGPLPPGRPAPRGGRPLLIGPAGRRRAARWPS